ncbi:MAG: sulfatase-like hydrolase/transferase [Mariniblastus sp.]
MKMPQPFGLRRIRLLFVFGLLSLTIGVITIESKAARAIDGLGTEKRTNIVLIMADDLGFECIGANGGTSYKTPVLDELAKTGMRFNHCYAQPICTPSRVKLMTGIYNVRNYEQFGILPRSQTTFANVFQKAGYKTCVVGKWQLDSKPHSPKHFGFDEYCLWHHTRRAERYPNPGIDFNGVTRDFDKGEYGPDVVSDFACEFMEKNKDQPFLLYYPMILTHCPFCPTPDSKDWDPKDKGSKTYKGNAKYFGDMVSYMDKTVGKITSKLDKLGIRENTLVMFIGDNGTDTPVVSMMGETKIAGAKGKTIDAGTHVPFIASWPGTIPAGKTSNDLVTFTDFFQTMCAAAKIEPPENTKQDGQSFLPQLKGEMGSPREWVYCFYARNGGAKGKEFVRNQRYKLYRDGKFFDVANDAREKNPLEIRDLLGEQKSVHEKLKSAINQYLDARPAAVSEIGEALLREKSEKKKAKNSKKKLQNKK